MISEKTQTLVDEAMNYARTVIEQLRLIEYDLDDINADTRRVEDEICQIRNSVFALQNSLNRISYRFLRKGEKDD